MADIGDVVLVSMDGSPAFFARVESVTPDVKPGWFHLQLLVLQVPLLVITWILRRAYIDGEEFTMGGRPVRIEKVVAPADESEEEPLPGLSDEPREDPREKGREGAGGAEGNGKVVSLAERRKKDQSS